MRSVPIREFRESKTSFGGRLRFRLQREEYDEELISEGAGFSLAYAFSRRTQSLNNVQTVCLSPLRLMVTYTYPPDGATDSVCMSSFQQFLNYSTQLRPSIVNAESLISNISLRALSIATGSMWYPTCV